MKLRRYLFMLALAALIVVGTPLVSMGSAGGISGAIFTTNQGGTAVNQNSYAAATDVYLSGGPQNLKANGLPDGTYYFQVTDPSGHTLLSSDNAVCRQLKVVNGRVAGSTGPACKHANGTLNPANGTLPVQLAPFDKTPNPDEVYKAWVVPVGRATISPTDPKALVFGNSDAKTDNFKSPNEPAVQQGSCQPSSSLSVLVSGSNVVSYVPKGSWGSATTGVAAVNVEGSSITNTLIPTSSVVNSCASNPLTGQTVCTANNTDVYALKGTALDSGVSPNPLTSGGSGLLSFSGGVCTNCGVAMDATHNKALLGLSVAGAGGFQFLNLATNTFEPAFASMAPGGFSANISEDPLLDPVRNLLLSANENNNYEIVDVANTTTPAFYENAVAGGSGEMDSSGEDCSTGIVLAPFEFSGPSQVYIADISNPTFAPFTAGSPGTWTAPQQVQSLADSFLAAGASGLAVAQGTHTAVLSGEFGGNAITALALPTTSGTGATPAISDWVTCSIPGWSQGFDPHTLTAYQSPTGGDAIGLLSNSSASLLARVDLTQMLNTTTVPRTGNACTGGTLPPSVVSFIAVP
jgi:hypothetical protein